MYARALLYLKTKFDVNVLFLRKLLAAILQDAIVKTDKYSSSVEYLQLGSEAGRAIFHGSMMNAFLRSGLGRVSKNIRSEDSLLS